MPRYTDPGRDGAAGQRPATVFEAVAETIRRVGRKDVINLHLGDTHTLPPGPATPAQLDQGRWPHFGQYCDTKGIPPLKDLLVEKLRRENGLAWADRDHIQVTCGAIHGLYASCAALLAPGEEVMVLSPHWHLCNEVIEQAGGVPRDTTFYVSLWEDPEADIPSLLEAGLTPSTAAIYLNSPCNPTGKVLDRSALEGVAAFAREHDLWVISDEAYENFLFTGGPHVSLATLPGMKDRTVTLFTFSKCLAAAGYRVGYTVARPDLTHRIHHASTRTIYNAPTDNQHMVVQALMTWEDWFPVLYQKYKANRDLVCERFKGRFHKPEGGFYVFFDAREKLRGDPPEGLLEEMVREGVACVPGRAFGEGFGEWFRLCFVAVPAEILAKGIERVNRVIGD